MRRGVAGDATYSKTMSRLVADLLRCLALIAVITIHADDAWRSVTTVPSDARTWAIATLDQFARFCVPLFVLLSGHGLGKRYAAGCAAGDFLSRRATRIGAPYLAWSALNLAIVVAVGIAVWDKAGPAALRDALHPGDGEAWWSAAVRWLLSGGADYHLYFLPIIAQCYLLFPLMRRWRCTPGAVALVIAAQVGALAWQEAARLTPAVPAPGLWSVFPLYWLGYFQAGIWLAAHDEYLAAALRRWPGTLIALLAVTGPAAVLADLVVVSARGVQPEQAGGFDRPAVAWYLATVVLAALRWGHHVDAWRPRAVALIGTIAAGSFAAYLSHTWVLRGLAWALGGAAAGVDKPLTRWVWIPLAVAASIAVGWLLQRAALRWRPLGWVVG